MIADYTIYDAATGRRIQTGRADTTLVEMQPGERMLVGVRAGEDQWVNPATEGLVAAPAAAPDLAARRAGMSMSPRQLILGLHAHGFITGEEAVAAATAGAMPAAVATVVATLPADAQIAARVTWARMTVVLRTDPLVDLLAASQGLTAAEVDAFFAACAAL